VNLNTHFFRAIWDGAACADTKWAGFHAYATTDPGEILYGPTPVPPPIPTCKPQNIYNIYNYYCSLGAAGDKMTERTLAQENCRCFIPNDIHNNPTTVYTAIPCDPVEAFIEVFDVNNIRPVFYRCYWHSDVAVGGGFEYVQFEWSATSEYIRWYISNLTTFGGNITPINNTVDPHVALGAGAILVPLLKVTNHSPNLP
jgi:hypothetical protein